jgi:hypothetical protein
MRFHHVASITLLILVLADCGEHGVSLHGSAATHGQEQPGEAFMAEKITRTAEIKLAGPIEDVFPLFNPVEEPKWAPQFQPSFVYPADNSVELGMTFTTAGHGDEADLVWRINHYDVAQHHIQYLVFGTNRYWTITIDCWAATDGQTNARVTYDFTPLSAAGAALSEAKANHMFEDDLADWENAINRYLGSR